MLLKKSGLLAGNTARESGRLFWELKLTEGRGTDLPIIYDGMKKNGSSAQAFETDEHRNYFFATICSSTYKFYLSFSGGTKKK